LTDLKLLKKSRKFQEPKTKSQINPNDLTRKCRNQKKDQSRKLEITKTRNKANKFFVFSNFRAFVIKKVFPKMQRIQNIDNDLILGQEKV